jgi:hypothetical protein
MPKPTTSLQFNSERTNPAERDGDLRKLVEENNLRLEPHQDHTNSLRRPAEGPALLEILRWLTRSLAALAVLSSFALLCVGATPMLSSLPAHVTKVELWCWALLRNMPLSALPLLLAGSSYIVLQAILRPRPLELVKRIMLGSAFLLWGVVQLMPASDLATELGNLVIALYVVDLGLMIWTDLERNQPHLVTSTAETA